MAHALRQIHRCPCKLLILLCIPMAAHGGQFVDDRFRRSLRRLLASVRRPDDGLDGFINKSVPCTWHGASLVRLTHAAHVLVTAWVASCATLPPYNSFGADVNSADGPAVKGDNRERDERRRAYAWGLICFILLAVGCSKPLYTRIVQNSEQRWAKALAIEADKRVAANLAALKAGVDRKEAIDFGRQLDSITSFYETVITVLLATLGLIAALAVWTVKSLSKAQADEAARTAVLEIMGGHEDFRRRLEKEVRSQLDLELEVIREQFENGGGLSQDSVILNPQKRSQKPHFILKTPPTA